MKGSALTGGSDEEPAMSHCQLIDPHGEDEKRLGRAVDGNAAPSPRSRRAAPCRLLVIEDEWLISELIRDQLDELNLAVAGIAATVDEALHLVEILEVDAALLDMNLHHKFSGEVADALKRKQVPFLFVSGYSKAPDPRHDGVPILIKPFEVADLQAALEHILPPQCLPRPDATVSGGELV
jgi:CheY-like chemotaxis protein